MASKGRELWAAFEGAGIPHQALSFRRAFRSEFIPSTNIAQPFIHRLLNIAPGQAA